MSKATQVTRLLHVIGGFGYGGTERLCLNLIAVMPGQVKHTVVALDRSRTGLEDAFRAYPNVVIEYGRMPTAGRLQFLWAMWRLMGRCRPDGVIVHIFGVAHVLMALAGRMAGVSAMAVAAGNPAPESAGRRKWRVLIGLSRLLRIPVKSCSRWVQQSLEALGTRLPAGSAVIYNGVDVAAIRADADVARAERSPEDDYVIGMVSRLDDIKDQATLIRAFAELPAIVDERRVVLRLIGDGALRGQLENLARTLGVEERVQFWGTRSDVPVLLGGFDIYAFSTTRDEGFGIALIEAMAAGLPIVATDVPPCREVSGDGEAAILVRPRDCRNMSDALGALIENGERRAGLASAGRARAAQLFDSRVTADRWLSAVGLSDA